MTQSAPQVVPRAGRASVTQRVPRQGAAAGLNNNKGASTSAWQAATLFVAQAVLLSPAGRPGQTPPHVRHEASDLIWDAQGLILRCRHSCGSEAAFAAAWCRTEHIDLAAEELIHSAKLLMY